MQPQMNNEEYHSRPEISKSDLDAAAKSGVHFLHKKEGTKSKPTPAMRIGSAFHALILEPDVFENEFIYKPEILNARSKEGKEWKARQEEAGKIVLNEDDKEQLQAMSKALLDCSPAKKLLSAAGNPEQSFFWTDKETGLGCKCRPDYLLENGGTIVDLKTTTDASYRGFLRSISNFRYHVQAGWYMNGLEQSTGERPDRFIFIAVEKTAPYGIGVYEADLYMTVNGYDQARIDLKKIAKWKEEENYPNYCTDIQQISLPSWMTGAAKGKTSVIPDIELF
tara:strand:- start:175 stop:1014 length:840 start_codon:yes stop_codon:yes gene_type:complete